jgi:hypothetical protein
MHFIIHLKKTIEVESKKDLAMSYEPFGYGDRWYQRGFGRPVIARNAIVPVAILLLAVLLIACLYNAVIDLQIAKRQQSALAVVVAHHPEDHDTYDLQISVGGSLYTSSMNTLVRGFTLNERIPVFFDPRAPQTMSLTSFSDAGEGLLFLIPFLFTGIVVLLGLTFHKTKAKP